MKPFWCEIYHSQFSGSANEMFLYATVLKRVELKWIGADQKLNSELLSED